MTLVFSAVSWSSFVLLGKTWAIGYVVVILGVLLGVIPVVLPTSMKKAKRKQ